MLPVSVPHPSCCFGSAATPSPLVPVEACPALVLPMPSTRKPVPISVPGQAQGGKDGQCKGCKALSTTPTPSCREQCHGFRYPPPVLFLLQPQFYQVSGLHGGRAGGAGGPVPEQASARHVSEAMPSAPTASYLTGVVFRDSLRQRIKILPQSRN